MDPALAQLLTHCESTIPPSSAGLIVSGAGMCVVFVTTLVLWSKCDFQPLVLVLQLANKFWLQTASAQSRYSDLETQTHDNANPQQTCNTQHIIAVLVMLTPYLLPIATLAWFAFNLSVHSGANGIPVFTFGLTFFFLAHGCLCWHQEEFFFSDVTRLSFLLSSIAFVTFVGNALYVCASQDTFTETGFGAICAMISATLIAVDIHNAQMRNSAQINLFELPRTAQQQQQPIDATFDDNMTTDQPTSRKKRARGFSLPNLFRPKQAAKIAQPQQPPQNFTTDSSSSETIQQSVEANPQQSINGEYSAHAILSHCKHPFLVMSTCVLVLHALVLVHHTQSIIPFVKLVFCVILDGYTLLLWRCQKIDNPTYLAAIFSLSRAVLFVSGRLWWIGHCCVSLFLITLSLGAQFQQNGNQIVEVGSVTNVAWTPEFWLSMVLVVATCCFRIFATNAGIPANPVEIGIIATCSAVLEIGVARVCQIMQTSTDFWQAISKLCTRTTTVAEDKLLAELFIVQIVAILFAFLCHFVVGSLLAALVLGFGPLEVIALVSGIQAYNQHGLAIHQDQSDQAAMNWGLWIPFAFVLALLVLETILIQQHTATSDLWIAKSMLWWPIILVCTYLLHSEHRKRDFLGVFIFFVVLVCGLFWWAIELAKLEGQYLRMYVCVAYVVFVCGLVTLREWHTSHSYEWLTKFGWALIAGANLLACVALCLAITGLTLKIAIVALGLSPAVAMFLFWRNTQQSLIWIAWVAVSLCFSISISVASSSPCHFFEGTSFFCVSLEVLCIVFMVRLRSLSWKDPDSPTRPASARMASEFIFPIFCTSPNGLIVQNNLPVFVVLLAYAIASFWGVTAFLFVVPRYVGLSVTCFAFVGIVVELLRCKYHHATQFSEKIDPTDQLVLRTRDYAFWIASVHVFGNAKAFDRKDLEKEKSKFQQNTWDIYQSLAPICWDKQVHDQTNNSELCEALVRWDQQRKTLLETHRNSQRYVITYSLIFYQRYSQNKGLLALVPNTRTKQSNAVVPHNQPNKSYRERVYQRLFANLLYRSARNMQPNRNEPVQTNDLVDVVPINIGKMTCATWRAPENLTLFGPNGPDFADINQRYLGNCFFLAVVNVMLSNHTVKDMIWHHMFTPVPNEPGTYYCQIAPNRRLKVTAEFPVDQNGEFLMAAPREIENGNVIWFPLLEKAIAHDLGSYKSLHYNYVDRGFDLVAQLTNLIVLPQTFELNNFLATPQLNVPTGNAPPTLSLSPVPNQVQRVRPIALRDFVLRFPKESQGIRGLISLLRHGLCVASLTEPEQQVGHAWGCLGVVEDERNKVYVVLRETRSGELKHKWISKEHPPEIIVKANWLANNARHHIVSLLDFVTEFEFIVVGTILKNDGVATMSANIAQQTELAVNISNVEGELLVLAKQKARDFRSNLRDNEPPPLWLTSANGATSEKGPWTHILLPLDSARTSLTLCNLGDTPTEVELFVFCENSTPVVKLVRREGGG